ncbi:MAG TPA: hypothetical protein VJ916_00965 [Anaerovoracaceae bacterium]|nr:hypothetical protein [Anaerovoracaceae bacterium]
MKNRSKYIVMVLAIVLLVPQITYADSSWYWVSKTRPFDILPFVAIGTILIEVMWIRYATRMKELGKVVIVVIVANLVSFLAPYVIEYFSMSWYGSFFDVIDSVPIFTVNAGFLLLTLAVEMPIVYNLLKKYVANKKMLMWHTLYANVATTVMLVIVERLICSGLWI